MIPEEVLQEIKGLCTGKENIKITVAVLQDGKIEKSLYGCDGIELPYRSYHYEIGSITKTFLGSILAKAVMNGVLSLEDRIDKYIPELDKYKIHPTIKRLVTHTSGYPSDSKEFEEQFINPEADNIYNQFTYNNIIELLKGIELEDKEYEASYSNFGTGVLAMVLEKALGKSVHVLMQDFLSELNMEETFLGIERCERMDIEGYNEANVALGNLLWTKECMIGPAGYLFSTVEDLITYGKLQMEESDGYLQMCHNTLAPYQRGEGAPFDIGICWMLIPKYNIIFHNGGTKGFHTIMCMNKTCKTAIIMLCNYMIEGVSNVALNYLVNLTSEK